MVLAVLGLFLAPVVWEVTLGVTLQLRHYAMSEMALVAFAKIGFVLVLAVFLLPTGGWRRWGFAGGLHSEVYPLLWPIWAASALALLQDLSQPPHWRALLWLPIALAVAIGEEGIFRGGIVRALRSLPPVWITLVSAFLFGIVHLAALAAPLDYRMVLAQAGAAFGLGIVLGAVRLLAGSIWPGIVAHTVLDFTGLAAAGGLTDALDYSAAGFLFMIAAALVTALWGLHLCRRLDQAALLP